MSAPPQVPRRTITQFCDHVCQYVRFHPDHAAIRPSWPPIWRTTPPR